jgi:hypothetical protein
LYPEDEIFSPYNTWVADDSPEGGKSVPMTWKEIAESRYEAMQDLHRFKRILVDLDRNEHGRHEGDVDIGDPSGYSQGNPRLKTGDILGYSLGGGKYIMPPREKRHDPTAWGPHYDEPSQE